MNLEDILNEARSKLEHIHKYLGKKTDRSWFFSETRECLLKRRMLSRACDYIQIIISHILDDKTNNQSALIDFHNHLSVIPNDGLGELSSLCALEIKTRLKVCSVRVAQVLANDDYLKICLDREYNLLSKRDAEKATPGSIDFPSEELNATWDVFLPSEDLSKMRDDYNLMILPVQKPPAAEPSAVRMSPDSNATVEAGGSTKNLETMRAQISTKLQHVYLSRAELNRYRASKNEIRGRYYTVLSMGMFACAILLILLLAYDHWAGIIKFDENQWKIDQQLNAARILILVLGAGALGSVLALMPKFRGMSRITDYRQAFVMLVAQIFTGATFALLFFFILRAGWIKIPLLDPSWFPVSPPPTGGAEATSGPHLLPVSQLILVSFFAGFSETLLLGVLERTGSAIKPRSLPPGSPVA